MEGNFDENKKELVASELIDIFKFLLNKKNYKK